MRFQAWHVILVIVAFILLFGWKNLPNAARSLGQSMRVFKSEVDQMKDENAARESRGATAADDRDRALDARDADVRTSDVRYRDETDRRGDDAAPRV